MVLFVIMILLTFADVLLRYCFNNPISGTVELTELLMAIIYFGALAKVQWDKGHICMDIITSRLGERGKTRIEFITSIWSFLTILWCIVMMIRFAILKPDWATMTWYIPYAPFLFLAAIGCTLLLIAITCDILNNTADLFEKDSQTAAWTCIFCAIAIALACIWFAAHRIPGIGSVTLGVIGLIFMFALFFTGMPVAFALMATAFVFLANLRGIRVAMDIGGNFWFGQAANYDWSPLMFFLIMGYFCFYGGFGEDLYRSARAFMGHLRGGLAMGSVCACTLFGAVVGDNLAGSVAMSAIALPEMRKAGYGDELSVGTLACSGTIGCLIPPSTAFIIYGLLAEQSIGDLFMAGVFPGLVCMFSFIFIIWIWTLINPAIAPAAPKTPTREAFGTLKTALPICGIFIVTIGGMYAGIFTATEGGAIGACITLILGLMLRRYNWKSFRGSLEDSSKAIVMCFTILAGAVAFGYFITLSRIPITLASSIAALEVGQYVVLGAIILCMALLGCFIPATPLIMICIPIFLPIANVYSWNLIWFGVIMVIMKNMAGITPPFGINLFVLKGISGIPLTQMYKAAMPFVAGLFLCLLIIIMFPSLSLWLPGMMK